MPAYVLHECAAPGCRRLAFAARCEAHSTHDDRARIAAMVPASTPVPAEGATVTLSFLPEDLHTMDGAQ